MSEGEVHKMDLETRRITFKHGPLKNLEMPPNDHGLPVADVAMLGKVKAGDKVRFVAAKSGGILLLEQALLGFAPDGVAPRANMTCIKAASGSPA